MCARPLTMVRCTWLCFGDDSSNSRSQRVGMCPHRTGLNDRVCGEYSSIKRDTMSTLPTVAPVQTAQIPETPQKPQELTDPLQWTYPICPRILRDPARLTRPRTATLFLRPTNSTLPATEIRIPHCPTMFPMALTATPPAHASVGLANRWIPLLAGAPQRPTASSAHSP